MHLSPALRGIFLAGAMLNVALAWQMKNPYLMAIRSFETPLAISLGVAGIALGQWLLRRHKVVRAEAMALAGLGMAAILVAVGHEAVFRYQRYEVLAANEEARTLGRHFIVGYVDFEEVATLAAHGLIGGVYISRKNVNGRSTSDLKREIGALQTIRRQAGLPPLFIAADQEGGSVAHLSPPLEAMPSLASLVSGDLPAGNLESQARAYGVSQGMGLSKLGVTLNFGPVVDLLYPDRRPGFDTHTRLEKRAIAADPIVVTRVAQAYGEGLMSQGVRATLKHFPGLGRVGVDTHHLMGHIDVPVDALRHADWQPFRSLAGSGAAIMVGHVIVGEIDPVRPASLSPKVIDGLLRKDWGFDGLIVTDDLNMGAVYRLGIGKAAVDALVAGADLVLVSYDPDQYFRAMSMAMTAYRQGIIGRSPLQASRLRLDRALQWQSRTTGMLLAARGEK